MGIPTLVRQRPGWWTQFGRSLLAGLAQTGIGLGESLLRGYLQNYFSKMAEQRALGRQKELLNLQQQQSLERQQRWADIQRQMAEEAARRQGLARVASRLLSSHEPYGVATGASLLIGGKKAEVPIYEGEEAKKKTIDRSPFVTRRATGVVVGKGYESPEPTYGELARRVGQFVKGLPPEQFKSPAERQAESQAQLKILDYRLKSLLERQKDLERLRRLKISARDKMLAQSLSGKIESLLRLTQSNPARLFSTDINDIIQQVDELTTKHLNDINMPQRPMPRGRGGNVLERVRSGRKGKKSVPVTAVNPLVQEYAKQLQQIKGLPPEKALENAQKIYQMKGEQWMRTILGQWK